MNSSLNSPARWTTVRAAGLAVVAAAIALPAASAEATCTVSNGIRTCAPSSSIHPLNISIGSDGSGQWIAYQDAETGSCTWDMIGNASAFYNPIAVTGTPYNDTIQTVASNGTVICGFPLNPPSPGSGSGRLLSLYSGGGYDNLLSYLAGPEVFLSCGFGANWCYFELWGPGTIVGSDSTDRVVKYGSGAWGFSTNGGDDSIYNWSSANALTSDCGSGTDYYYGTWDTHTVNCEVR